MFDGRINNNRIGNANKMADKKIGPNTIVSKFERLYEDFVTNIDKGDFKNSPQRYIIELSHLDNLIKVADENGMPEVADKYRAKKGTVVAEFEKLGFEYKG